MSRCALVLNAAGVGQVWLESRTSSLNVKDVEAIDAFRAAGAIDPGIVVGHARPSAEPLLWVPDIVAGAIGGELDRSEPFAAELAAVVTRYQIELR